jgi:hypothetical protein
MENLRLQSQSLCTAGDREFQPLAENIRLKRQHFSVEAAPDPEKTRLCRAQIRRLYLSTSDGRVPPVCRTAALARPSPQGNLNGERSQSDESEHGRGIGVCFGGRRGSYPASMTMAGDQNADLKTIATVIAHSQIVVRYALPRVVVRPALPAGFEDADIAILDWIVREARWAGRSLTQT